jgi:23S rRNA pseudouridine2605 synthase
MPRRSEPSGERSRRTPKPFGAKDKSFGPKTGRKPFGDKPRRRPGDDEAAEAPGRKVRSTRPKSDRIRVADEGENAPSADGKERLQKVLAAAGLGSRRDCEELITQGRVEIDRVPATELGVKVDPATQEVRVDGVALPRPKRVYFVVNKPMGVVCTNWDPSGRTRVIDLVDTNERIFAVGRLDRSSEGLIIVTNDGSLAHELTHPKFGIEKTYAVRVEGVPTLEQINKLRRGVWISDGLCKVRSIVVKKRHRNCCDLIIVLNEGKNREIRRIMIKIGHKVLRLKRIAIGNLRLGEMPTGGVRKLHPSEIESLLEAGRESRRELRAENRVAKKRSAAKRAEESAQLPPEATMPQVLGKPKAAAPTAAPKPLDLNELLNVRGPYRVTESDVVPADAEDDFYSDDEGIPMPTSGSAPIGDVIDYDEPLPEEMFSDEEGEGEAEEPRPRGPRDRGQRGPAGGRMARERGTGGRVSGGRTSGGRTSRTRGDGSVRSERVPGKRPFGKRPRGEEGDRGERPQRRDSESRYSEGRRDEERPRGEGPPKKFAKKRFNKSGGKPSFGDKKFGGPKKFGGKKFGKGRPQRGK